MERYIFINKWKITNEETNSNTLHKNTEYLYYCKPTYFHERFNSEYIGDDKISTKMFQIQVK